MFIHNGRIYAIAAIRTKGKALPTERFCSISPTLKLLMDQFGISHCRSHAAQIQAHKNFTAILTFIQKKIRPILKWHCSIVHAFRCSVCKFWFAVRRRGFIVHEQCAIVLIMSGVGNKQWVFCTDFAIVCHEVWYKLCRERGTVNKQLGFVHELCSSVRARLGIVKEPHGEVCFKASKSVLHLLWSYSALL